MPEQKTSALSLPISIVFGSLIIAGAILLINKPADTKTVAGAEDKAANVPAVSQTDHVRGDANAPVTLIEYADFQCPYCDVIHGTLKKLVADSGGKVKWVYRNLPLDGIHEEARPAALAAECVASLKGNDAYWQFADAMFSSQKNLSASFYKQTATALGVDGTAFDQCVSSNKFGSRIDTQVSDAVSAGIQGTPYTVVVGKEKSVPFSGALQESQIKSVINAVQGIAE